MSVALFIWIALVILFLVVEFATVGLISIWFFGGALVAMIAALCGANVYVQVLLFAAVSLLLLGFTRPWAVKYLKPHLTRTNYEETIGKQVCVIEPVDNKSNTGTVVLNGQEWRARAWNEGCVYEPGMILTVREIRGVTMFVG